MALSFSCSTNLAITLSRSHRCPHIPTFTRASSPFSILVFQPFVSTFSFTKKKRVGAVMFAGINNPIAADLCAAAISGAVALSLLRFWEETAKRGLFDQKVNRKLVHISVGLVFMLCWPMFSHQGALIAALIPGLNIIKMLLMGLGIWKDEATVKSMSRFGDYRELLKGPLYYALTITLACAVYWRGSPIAIAAICNLCAGDGLADIIGRRFGSQKLPYNSNKSIAGSVAMLTAGFIVSVGYMHYFCSFGYLEESWEMVLGFLIVSLASTLVESHPLSTVLDDNLTVPLASLLVEVWYCSVVRGSYCSMQTVKTCYINNLKCIPFLYKPYIN